MSYGRFYPRAYPGELRQPAPAAPPKAFVPLPKVKVTRVGRRVRLRWRYLEAAHEYPNLFQAKRMAIVLRTSASACRRFLGKFREGRR